MLGGVCVADAMEHGGTGLKTGRVSKSHVAGSDLAVLICILAPHGSSVMVAPGIGDINDGLVPISARYSSLISLSAACEDERGDLVGSGVL